MQNFTLRKRGISMLLFALILLTTSFPSFAQENCPTVTNEEQSFCYLATVSDLEASGDALRWYRTLESTTPIPENELLQDGNYYAGNANGTCTTRRLVEVTVDNYGAPTTQFGVIFQPCEFGESDNSTVGDLIALVQGNNVEIYTEEYSGNPLPSSTVLEDGMSYFAGQRNPNTNCPTSRLALRYDPVLALAPTGDDTQTFCPEATVADLQAQATSPNTQAFRWYSTLTSNPALSPSTPLVNGEVYYASQIVNRSNSSLPPCESQDRFKVTVTIQEPFAGAPNTGIVCESDVLETFESIDAINNYLLDLLEEGVPTNGTFNPTAQQLAQQYQNDADGLGDFTTTYTVASGDCPASVDLTISIVAAEEANASEDRELEFNVSEGDQNLFTYLSEGANPNGYFENYPEGIFNPSEEGAGIYTVNYIVDPSIACVTGTDEALFTITVIDCEANAGADVNASLCSSQVEEFIANPALALAFFGNLIDENVDQTGTFDPSLQSIAAQWSTNPIGTFTTTYTVGEGDCQDSAVITINVTDGSTVNAGADNTGVVCETDVLSTFPDFPAIRNYYIGLLEEGVPTNGTFEPTMEELAANYQADNDGLGDFTTTYTVGNGECTDSVELTISVVPAEPATTGEIADTSICTSEDTINLFNFLSEANTMGGNFYQNGEMIANGSLIVSEGEYTITYTVSEADPATCLSGTASTTFVLTLNQGDAYAGEDGSVTLNESDAPVNLMDYLGGTPEMGGTWSNGDGSFDPATDAAGVYTYTVGTEPCQDTATVTVTINTVTDPTCPIDAGNPGMAVVCSADVIPTFPSVDEIRKYYLNLLDTGVARNGTFNPTPRQISEQYQADPDGLGDFTTTYTITNGDCSDSVELTVRVVESANAGTNGSVTLNEDDAAVNLFDYLGGTPDVGGTWSNGNGTFDPATDAAGVYTYTVGTESCQATATVTVTVNTETDPTCTIDAGDDVNVQLCTAQVEDFIANPASAAEFFSSLIDEDIDQTGTFNPTLETIVAQWMSNPVGTFTSTYTLTEEDCSDSATITLVVTEGGANAGENGSVTLNESDAPINLMDYLGGTPDMGGTWSNGDGFFDPATDAAGVYTYTIGTEPCQDAATVTVTVNTETDPTCNAGTPGIGVVCLADVNATFPSVDEIRKYYLNLLDTGVARNGTFNPTPRQISEQYQADSDGLGDFTTTYTIANGDCSDSVELTVRVVESVNAGTNGSVTLNEDDAAVNLFDYLGGTPDVGGTWSNGNGTFDPATDAAGVYTYTVGTESCQATATVTVTVNNETDPTECEDVISAGGDKSIEVCNSQVRNLRDNGVRNLYISLLDEGVPTNGTFNPTVAELIAQYNIVSNYGDFTTTYTVVSGDCQDSAVLTVTVLEANDAGEDRNITFCNTQEPVNLFDYLSPFATTTGTFIGYEDGMFDPATADAETVITYEVEEDDSECSANNFTAAFTITVAEPQDANAGGDRVVNICLDDTEEVDLFSILGEGALMTGSFSAPYEDGMFDPVAEGEGEYVITYTVDESSCAIGTDTATLTISVGGSQSQAPVADAEQFFCLSEGATVANLVATGGAEDTIVWYTDAELTTEADPTTALVTDAVYYAVAVSENACAPSEAVMVTVTLEDSVAPTIPNLGNEFCRQDNPTVQDLMTRLNGSDVRVYTSSTGGTALVSTTALEDGITYYATSTDATVGCESTERLLVNVIVGFCGIPEGFSPNGDGTNDTFEIPNIRRDYPNYNIEIYNRWGNMVYKGNQDWDGVSNQSTTLGDEVLPAGVYFYILNYNDGQTSPVQGKVYLSR
ncbi:gliding motility-associated C-terminal domain-containing protein [Antarcticibacterium sp. 1MA-6-2]|uniref:gliding motility-associated C-terminal domain-containing protein n=1 Tax=Antarcticibacterium sp. 1MA-6-2 TaxID=2908210 RepID=UPI001F28C6F4|nr:gliding motility-associated C-terminal domain-containing protein [Antarcticibacterium sp. 1MA-6-2]UJH89765.1 gliding motility-associated C-terminal domain-containing protein [Antarcticibacterium sp. 1MA-6-2]